MTAIVGIVHDGKTWIGADSCVSDDGTRASSTSKKLWRAGGYIIGAAGNGGWYAVLRHLRWPTVASPGYMLNGMVGDLLAASRALDITLPAEKGTPADGSAIVGGCGKLWYIDSDLVVDEYTEMCAGSGGDGALCVLAACKAGTPKFRILKSLEAVASVRYDVAPPFFVENI